VSAAATVAAAVAIAAAAAVVAAVAIEYEGSATCVRGIATCMRAPPRAYPHRHMQRDCPMGQKGVRGDGGEET